MPAPVKPAAKKVPPKPAAAAAAAATAAAAPTPAPAGEPGRGTDVVGVRTEGAEFPYPAYLENIVRQIALRFKVPRNSAARAEVMFVVRRDGSIVPNSLQFVSRSGNFAFDLEAQGAVEQAGAVKAFGPLPSGFADDVLPVVFSFDPRVLH
jgi:protein TonB